MIYPLNQIQMHWIVQLYEIQFLNEMKRKTKSKNILKCARAHLSCARTHIHIQRFLFVHKNSFIREVNVKNLRIKDIAKLAGVSAGTVDRVLHDRGRVSEKALEKVMKVMNEIEYRPNLIARSLSSSKKYRIGVMIPNPESDPYWAQTEQGILQAKADWAQYGIIIDSYFFDQYNKESFNLKTLEVLSFKLDGIVVAPIFYDEALLLFKLLENNNIPYVLFNTNIPVAHALSFIGQDLFHSGLLAAKLLSLGQVEGGKLAVVHMDEDIHNSIHLLEKERGFCDYFKKMNKFSFEIEEFNLSPKDPHLNNQFNNLLRDSNLKGIFVSTSKGTSIVASMLENHGKKNIGLIGYDMLDDNLKYLSSGIIDFLINQNPKRQSFLGISHMVNYLLFKKVAPKTELFPLEIITQQNVDSYKSSAIH